MNIESTDSSPITPTAGLCTCTEPAGPCRCGDTEAGCDCVPCNGGDVCRCAADCNCDNCKCTDIPE